AYPIPGPVWGAHPFRPRAELSSGAMTPLTRNSLLLAVTVCALVFAALALTTTMTTALARAADESQTRGPDSEAELPSAPVVIDGITLFRVRGTSLFPADKRAAVIASRIKTLAADRAVPVDALRPVEIENGASIETPGHHVMTVFDTEARHGWMAGCSRRHFSAASEGLWSTIGRRAPRRR